MNQQVRRKLKIFIGIGLSVTFIVVALFVFAGVTAVKQVVSLGNDPQIKEKVQNLKGEINNIHALAKVGCWDKVQGFMNVEVWLEKPIADNLNSIKLACFANESSGQK